MKLPKELQRKRKRSQKNNKKQERIEFSKKVSEINRKCRFKGCLFPDKSKCTSRKGIRAHSIQRNKILSSIAQSGKVKCFDIRNSLFDKDFSDVGIAEASTFFGFCNFHDTKVFSDIENFDYINSPKQNLLFAYRACAFEVAMCKQAFCHSNLKVEEAGSKEEWLSLLQFSHKAKVDMEDIEKK